MFTRNKSKSEGKFGFFPADSISTVAGSMRMTGDIEAEHDMRIDGKIYGNVYCNAKVVLGPSGIVEGDLHAQNADIFGSVNGNIVVKDMLCLKSKCNISGNLTIGKLDIEPEAEFNGTCTMVHENTTSTQTTKTAPQRSAQLVEEY
jgi:cytoskeletal protein CcmA (bactofilin family)